LFCLVPIRFGNALSNSAPLSMKPYRPLLQICLAIYESGAALKPASGASWAPTLFPGTVKRPGFNDPKGKDLGEVSTPGAVAALRMTMSGDKTRPGILSGLIARGNDMSLVAGFLH
jgi:hypothetical protein